MDLQDKCGWCTATGVCVGQHHRDACLWPESDRDAAEAVYNDPDIGTTDPLPDTHEPPEYDPDIPEAVPQVLPPPGLIVIED